MSGKGYVMLVEDWLRGCVHHDGRHGEVTLPCDEVLGIADYIESTRSKVEVVRCKDCKHWRDDHTCHEHSLVSPMGANEFCSRGERGDSDIEALSNSQNHTDSLIRTSADSVSEADVIYRSEPKTAENGSLDSEMPEIKTDRITGGKIYRQDAIAAVKRICWNCSNTICHNLINEMSAFPSAQRKGEWIMHLDDLFPAESTMECNQCHKNQPITIDNNYCPHCGADMRGKQNG